MDETLQHRKAVVVGATGLIGSQLVKQLIENSCYSEIRILGRRNIDIQHEKIRFYQVDMDQLQKHASLFEVEDVFCCLGSTIKKAGSQENFKKVDLYMVIAAAKATEQYAQQFIMVSSLGAKADSWNFYLKTKGEAEKSVLAMNIPSIYILRPSILFGDRKEKRGGEKMGIYFMKFFSPVMIGPLKKFRGNKDTSVAKIMIQCALSGKKGKYIYESTDIEQMIKNNRKISSPLNPSI
jgi:uncharacterized protein YbjT (DUF2867 family)